MKHHLTLCAILFSAIAATSHASESLPFCVDELGDASQKQQYLLTNKAKEPKVSLDWSSLAKKNKRAFVTQGLIESLPASSKEVVVWRALERTPGQHQGKHVTPKLKVNNNLRASLDTAYAEYYYSATPRTNSIAESILRTHRDKNGEIPSELHIPELISKYKGLGATPSAHSLAPTPLTSDATIQIRGPGTPVNEGELGKIEPNALVALGTMPNGRKCLRPLSTSDWGRTIGEKSNLNIVYEKTGFGELGFLASYDINRETAIQTCTFVLVSDRHALTSAHCVSRPINNEKEVHTDTDYHKMYLAFIPKKEKSENSTISSCFSKNDTVKKKCAYHVGVITLPPEIPSDTVWVPRGSSFTATPDIALLHLKFESDDHLRWAAIPDNNILASPVAYGGFGITNDGLLAAHFPMIGFRQTDGVIHNPPNFFLLSNDINRGSTVCFGDSGGAVFDKTYNGNSAENQKIVSAIISGAVDLKDSKDKGTRCDSAQSALAQSVYSVKEWLCNRSNNHINGC